MNEAVYCSTKYKPVLGEKFADYKYENLINGSKEFFTFYIQNKNDASYKKVKESDNKWGKTKGYITANAFVDGNSETAYDFVGGKKGEESYNFVITFDGEELFDKIVFASAEWESVFPTRINFYTGNSVEEVFSSEAKPIKEYFEATENGEYIADFEPIRAENIRIEVLDNRNDYYEGLIMCLVKDIAVYGVVDAPQATFGQKLVKSLKTARTKPVSVMQPFLYRGADGCWTNSEWKPISEYKEDDIDITYLGDGFTEVDCNNARLLNVGSVNDPALISKQEPLPVWENIDELYFYVKLTSKGNFASGKVNIQLVNGKHLSSTFSFVLEPDKWTKIDLRSLVTSQVFEGYRGSVEEDKLRRFAINSPDGKLNTKICVGSVLASSKVDWSKYGFDFEKIKHYSEAEWREFAQNNGINLTAITGKKYDF